MRSLERIVSAYLDLAEDCAERHIPMTWKTGQSVWIYFSWLMIERLW